MVPWRNGGMCGALEVDTSRLRLIYDSTVCIYVIGLSLAGHVQFLVGLFSPGGAKKDPQ